MRKPNPKAGWNRAVLIGRDIGHQMQQAQLFQVASSLAYTTILSLIPLLAMSFAIFKAFGGMERLLETIQPFILSNLAEGTSEEVLKRIESFISNVHASTLGVGAFLGLIFTSMSMLLSAEKAINKVWGTQLKRSWFQRISSYWLVITLGPVALSIALGAATTGDVQIAKIFPSGTGIFVLTVGIFFLVYKFVPNTKVDWRYALFSATITSAFWNLARIAYAFYTKKAVSYNKIYGSLAAVPILLLWIYIIWVIILSGAALSAALQRRLEPFKSD